MNKIISSDMESLINNCPYVDEFKNKTILITGATGLIARNLTFFFLELNRKMNTNVKVVALVRNIEKSKVAFADYLNDDNFEFLVQDVCEPIRYEGDVNYVFHAAGSCSAYAIKTNPVGIIKANTIGTMNVLDFAKENTSANHG